MLESIKMDEYVDWIILDYDNVADFCEHGNKCLVTM